MNFYFRIGWLSVAFLLAFQLGFATFSNAKPEPSAPTMLLLAILPLANLAFWKIRNLANSEKKITVPRIRIARKTAAKIAAAVLAAFTAMLLGGGPFGFLVAGYSAYALLFSLDGRTSYFAAFLFLAFCPVFVFSGRGDLSESSAAAAFLLLCVGVVGDVSETVSRKSRGEW